MRSLRPTDWLAAAIAAAALSAWPSIAHAQHGSVAAARHAFERGVAALNEGRFADALSALQESYQIRPSPIVLYDLGLAYRALGRYREAADAFQRYLAEPEHGADARRLGTVRDELQRLQRSLVHLHVTAQPPTASLQIDGRPIEIGNGDVLLDPGAHIVELNADGYRTFRQELNLQPGASSDLRAQLEPTAWAARLVVSASVPAATVYIDDQFVGTGHADRHLPSGEHRIEVHAPGYDVFHRSVHIGVEGVVNVDASLDREGHNRWMLPAGIAAGAVVIGVAVLVGVVVSNQSAPSYPATWGNVQALVVH